MNIGLAHPYLSYLLYFVILTGLISWIGDFIKIKNDSISVYLPFFGERRILNYGHSATNHESFIVYTGVPQRLKSSFDKEKNEYRYDMRFKRNRESFRIRLTIQGNGSTRLFVSSTNRSSIFYLGKVKPLGDS